MSTPSPEMSEQEFYLRVDCNFPYHDPPEAARLTKLACSISSNAAFLVVHELARVPAGAQVDPQILLGMLRDVDDCLDHPLKPQVFTIARRMIMGDKLALPEVLQVMHQLAAYPNEYPALNVVYFSGAEAWDEVEALYDRIVSDWKAGSD